MTCRLSCLSSVFFVTDTAPTAIYTLSLHDALPISAATGNGGRRRRCAGGGRASAGRSRHRRRKILRVSSDRKSTRLNSSHVSISYAVFCLKKKNQSTPALHLHTRSVCHRVSRPSRR